MASPRHPVSKKKQKLIDEFNAKPLSIGDKVELSDNFFNDNKYCGLRRHEAYTIDGIEDDFVFIGGTKVHKSYILKYDQIYIGANPFNKKYKPVRPVAFSLDSIIFSLELSEKRKEKPYEIDLIPIMEVNWDPFVIDKDGNKYRYQRDFCWTKKQNQLLIESIYLGINCGTILVRKRGWKQLENMAKNGETELSFTDIVDGKQRLNAIRLFINDKFPDLHGNYYSDLSLVAQVAFNNNQLLQYAEMSENSSDDDTIYQFLLMNHEGVPQSKQHINYVKDILKNITE